VTIRVGLISDTHGLLRPQATAFLQGCSHIIHAGDIGQQNILEQLLLIAPVTAVRGNNDTGSWAFALPVTECLQLGSVHIHVVHDLAELKNKPHPEGIDVIVSGHSHRPLIAERDAVLYVNPGSAGPRRFRLPITLAELRIANRQVSASIVTLDGQGAARAERR
jgi:hypothetical protein